MGHNVLTQQQILCKETNKNRRFKVYEAGKFWFQKEIFSGRPGGDHANISPTKTTKLHDSH